MMNTMMIKRLDLFVLVNKLYVTGIILSHFKFQTEDNVNYPLLNDLNLFLANKDE